MTLSEERPHQTSNFTSLSASIKSKEAERAEIEIKTQEYLRRNKLKTVPYDPNGYSHGAPENALGIDSSCHRKKGKENAAIPNRHHDIDDGFDVDDLLG